MARIEESVEINSPVEKVFTFTTDAKSWNKWNSVIIDANQTSPGPVDVGATFQGICRIMGRTMKWTSTVTEYKSPDKFGKDITSGSVLIEQHNTYTPTTGGTKFNLSYDMKVGGLLKLMSPLLERSMRKELKKSLGNLKQVVERKG